ncbi:TraR/DksA C4-type zinc finger protein [Phenylobacterium ferrooxidans]|uniref:TraR/DksA C4-type zinc finger protein n=1 Tax=Phenylobacterium ferrooxidans TaxID=2982689 RepID=A0ABW6CN61_9CAUL
MTDVIDDAQRFEAFRRDLALAAALAGERRRDVVFGVLVCADCDDPMEDERLAARPEAIRCLTCQEAHERRLALHARSLP